MNVINKFDKDHISEYSAEAAFFMVLSFIPFKPIALVSFLPVIIIGIVRELRRKI